MIESSAEAKLRLRRQVRAARRSRAAAADPHERADLGRSLARHLGAFLAKHDAGTPWVAVFESLPTEPPTAELTHLLTERGHRVIVPVLLADKDLSWRDLATGADLGTDAISRAGLIVLPALAVDVTGRRLGQGGGSYDRALLRSDPDALRLAVVFEQEVRDVVPADDHDQPVHAVLTPDRGVRRFPLTD